MIIKGKQLECSQNALLGLGNLSARSPSVLQPLFGMQPLSHVRELGVGKLGEWHGWEVAAGQSVSGK